MKGKSLSIVLIFSLALNLAVVGTFIFFKLNRPDFERESFNFDKEQKEKMFDNFRELHQLTRDNRKQIDQLENDLQQLLLADSLDSREINLLIDRIGQKKLQLSKLTINHLLDSKAVLTKEQRLHFIKMLMKGGRRSGRGPLKEGDRFNNKRRFGKPQSRDSL